MEGLSTLFMRFQFVSAVMLLFLAMGCAPSEAPPKVSGPPKPKITASPNPVPAGQGPGTTRISAEVGDEPLSEVYVSINGGEEQRIFRVEKSRELGWINSGAVYEFRLYRGTNRAELLDSVKVTKAK